MTLTYKTLIKDAPCKQACPAGIDIPLYIRLIKKEKFSEALGEVRRAMPFPGVCGRVCTHPCEPECERGKVDEPLSIRALHRFLADHELRNGRKKATPAGKTKEERVAIVGSGPAGLSCAHELVRRGYPVTVFEAAPEPGGMLRYGIPEYRLPKEVLDEEISYIKELGVEIKTIHPVRSLKELFGKGYKAIFLATGAWVNQKLEIPGERGEGIFYALDFLKKINSGEKVKVGKRVAIVGGGNAAVDAARVAKRLGAAEVLITYRRSRNEMTAIRAEVDEAEKEGVKFQFLTTPVQVLNNNGRLNGIQCIRMELGEPDESGRPLPMTIQGSEFILHADQLIVAIGQRADNNAFIEDLEYTNSGTLSVDAVTLKTNIEGVFAAGDAVTGTASVVEAIAAGQRSAISIDKYLGSGGIIEELPEVSKEASTCLGFEESTLERKRNSMPLLEKAKRLATFGEVELGFKKEVAIEEASRCLGCDQHVLVSIHPDRCTKCYRCQMMCSLIYEGAFNPERARIVISLPEISWTEECIGGCALCIQCCLNKAITLE
jgi:NADPH-dependent glutamate synthase beta subunit-like oxidoreductase